MGLAAVVRAVCGLFPDGGGSWLALQMKHAPWGGFSFYDLIFPLFLFMAGMSFPFSYASQVKKGVSPAKIHWRMFKRMMLLILLSMVHCGALQFDPDKYRYVSVLQRIGITGFLAGLVYVHFKPRARVAIAVSVLAGYWALLTFCPSPLAPEGAGPFPKQGNIVDWLDRYLSMRSWFGRDPFEIRDIPLSVIQIPLTLLGMFTADLVRSGRFTPEGKSLRIAVIAAVLSVVGIMIIFAGCDIVKNISTPSFMLVTGGLCMLLFAAFHWVIDVKGFTAWSFPLRVVGMNALVAYLMQTVLPINSTVKFLFGGLASVSGMPNVVMAVGYCAVCWLILYFLHRNKVYVKV
jgi:predicted acyltransferase